MKKINFVAALLFCGLTVSAQAVKDRNVIPVAVNLNQVLRMTISNGGNIEFVFNTIADYKNGLSAATTGSGAMYETDFSISSSTRWKLTYGSETVDFQGVDNPANKLLLNNVGYKLTETGTHTFAPGIAAPTNLLGELHSPITNGGIEIAALAVYPKTLIQDNDGTGVALGIAANAGDESDNVFKMSWRVGTKENSVGGTVVDKMNALAIIDQQPSPEPDRYVANVIFELSMDN